MAHLQYGSHKGTRGRAAIAGYIFVASELPGDELQFSDNHFCPLTDRQSTRSFSALQYRRAAIRKMANLTNGHDVALTLYRSDTRRPPSGPRLAKALIASDNLDPALIRAVLSIVDPHIATGVKRRERGGVLSAPDRADLNVNNSIQTKLRVSRRLDIEQTAGPLPLRAQRCDSCRIAKDGLRERRGSCRG